MPQLLFLITSDPRTSHRPAEAIRIAQPWGVDASSRLESAPGIKDPEKVRQFVKAALAAESAHRRESVVRD